MPRKKSSPNRQDGRYEVKITIGKTLQGKLIRKSFYSEISKADAKKKPMPGLSSKRSAS